MNFRIVQSKGIRYLEALPGNQLIANERDAVDWIGLCGENDTRLLMLYAANLTPDFYDLRSGVAGAILLKFVIYRLVVAAVLTPDLVNRGRFREMVAETNRGSAFRVFYDRERAEEWFAREGALAAGSKRG